MAETDKYGQTTPLNPDELKANGGNGNGHDDVNRLLAVLFAPTLTLVEHYLMAKNGTKKTRQNCVYEFSERYPKQWWLIFTIDLGWRLVSVGMVAFVFARGLGIIG